jgi:tellurite resistance protein
MGFWKILGGITIGVGAVAAAPFTGGGSVLAGVSLLSSLAGAGTVAAAVGSGIAGGTIGAVMSDSDKEEGRREGERIATAKYEQKVEKLNRALEETLGKMKEDKSYFQLIIALFAVGMATANADGNVSAEEINELDEFITGAAYSSLPPHVKEVIAKLKANPPTFNEAMQLAKKLDEIDKILFETVIELVSLSDGSVNDKERAILAAFRQKAA